MKKRMMQVADFIIDIDKYEENLLNEVVQFYFDQTTGGKVKFKYVKDMDGYRYEISRELKYGYKGDWIFELDCATLTGLPSEKFRINPLEPDREPVVFCIPGQNKDGFYAPTSEIENLYKAMVSCDDDWEKPKEVSIQATDDLLSIEVEYSRRKAK